MEYIEEIVDIQTGEVTQQPYSAEQIAEVEKSLAKIAEDNEKYAAKEAARQAVLDKLGLTVDEVAALGL